MTRDVYMRIICIPLLGIFLPVIAGIFNYAHYSHLQIVFGNLYFIFTSFIIWAGCNWIHATLRRVLSPFMTSMKKLVSVCMATALYGICIGCLSALGWFQFANEIFGWNKILSFSLVCTITVIVFTLLYEILYLAIEKEQDHLKVDQLSKEKSQATLYALQNEMDPHFLFNALNTLNHLILTKPETAHAYNNKLAQVYKYFLTNRNNELVSLEKELNFISDYYFLLQLRFGKKLQLAIQTELASRKYIQIPPCSLQILLENAIKHNSFTEKEPLCVNVSIEENVIKVYNKKRPKPFLADSTQIGLKNLQARYKLLFDTDIRVHTGKENFTVLLPVGQIIEP